MKKILLVLLCASVSLPVFAGYQKKNNKKDKKAGNEVAREAVTLADQKDSVGYAFGIMMAHSLLDENLPEYMRNINVEALKQGFLASFNERETLLDPEQVGQYFQELYMAEMERQEEEAQKERDRAREESAGFLREKAEEEGVVATSSGLLYRVVKEGEGDKPDMNSTVRVRYKLSLTDGTVIEDTKVMEEEGIRESEVEFPLDRVIRGWQEGLQLMSRGAVYMLYIPNELAYGEYGMNGIPGGSALVFEVELIDFYENAGDYHEYDEDEEVYSEEGDGSWEYVEGDDGEGYWIYIEDEEEAGDE